MVPKQIGPKLLSVSYTHLDVYKRQLHDSSIHSRDRLISYFLVHFCQRIWAREYKQRHTSARSHPHSNVIIVLYLSLPGTELNTGCYINQVFVAINGAQTDWPQIIIKLKNRYSPSIAPLHIPTYPEKVIPKLVFIYIIY